LNTPDFNHQPLTPPQLEEPFFRHLLRMVRLPIQFVGLLWAIHVFQYVTGVSFRDWGIIPRLVVGLRGILFAPLLHADFGHLLSNSFPMLLLGSMLLMVYPRIALRVFWTIYFISGFGLWVFARDASHIGLSYVIYGLVSFIFWLGLFRRSVRAIFLMLLVLVLYNGLFLGIVPSTYNQLNNISWDGHLIGAITGILVAFYYKDELEENEKNQFRYTHTLPTQAFFAPTVFDETKAERAARLEREWLEQQQQYW
jgi:membrane associated rhomboid family serine protease